MSDLDMVSASIKRVAVIDDKKEARDSLAEYIVDARLQPIVHENHFENLDAFLVRVRDTADAAVCDHHLSPGNYAKFKGAEAVAKLYRAHIPALLVTAYLNSNLEIRPCRREIPLVLPSMGWEPEMIRVGFKMCLEEFDHVYTLERRPQRTILRVEDIDGDSGNLYVVIPAWNTKLVVDIPAIMLPRHIGPIKAGNRLLAVVNVGANDESELYFDDFSIDEDI